MKNLESLKGNKFDTKDIKGGAKPYDANDNVHMTASYTRPAWDGNGMIINDRYDASTSGDPGYSNVIDN